MAGLGNLTGLRAGLPQPSQQRVPCPCDEHFSMYGANTSVILRNVHSVKHPRPEFTIQDMVQQLGGGNKEPVKLFMLSGVSLAILLDVVVKQGRVDLVRSYCDAVDGKGFTLAYESWAGVLPLRQPGDEENSGYDGGYEFDQPDPADQPAAAAHRPAKQLCVGEEQARAPPTREQAIGLILVISFF